jgi:hypothetical protein
MAALRATAEAEGWQIVFACADAACGGFDFRFALDLIPEPDMHVNLADFASSLRGAMGRPGRSI